MERIKEKITVYVILGPTCTGKTKLALKLCQKFDGEIISFDSRQIYKYMDIGTGKYPSDISKNQPDIKIYGYDLVEPDEFFSSYDFTKYAIKKILQISKTNKKIFLTGGTGFYLDAVTGRVKPSNIEPDPSLRKKLNTYSLLQLQNILKKLSFDNYEKIDKNNPVRLIRSIEKLKSKKVQKALNYPKNIKYKIIGLTAGREILYQNADNWVDGIWNENFKKEVEFLINSKYKNSDKINGFIYKSMKNFLQNNISWEEAKQQAKYDMHSYIRRQQTYFKKIPKVEWIDIYQDNFEKKLYNIIK